MAYGARPDLIDSVGVEQVNRHSRPPSRAFAIDMWA
jgi:hypothetical protein